MSHGQGIKLRYLMPWRYTNVDMKIYRYLLSSQKNNMAMVSQYNTVYFLRYTQPRYRLFYKQQFFKQRQTEIGLKIRKC